MGRHGDDKRPRRHPSYTASDQQSLDQIVEFSPAKKRRTGNIWSEYMTKPEAETPRFSTWGASNCFHGFGSRSSGKFELVNYPSQKSETTARTWRRRVLRGSWACTPLCLACVAVSMFLARVVCNSVNASQTRCTPRLEGLFTQLWRSLEHQARTELVWWHVIHVTSCHSLWCHPIILPFPVMSSDYSAIPCDVIRLFCHSLWCHPIILPFPVMSSDYSAIPCDVIRLFCHSLWCHPIILPFPVMSSDYSAHFLFQTPLNLFSSSHRMAVTGTCANFFGRNSPLSNDALIFL